VRGEDRFVEKLRALLPRSERLRIGPGDDAAVLSSGGADLVLTTDLLVEGVDFLPDEDPETIGRRALAVNLSDIAAMGGRPEFFLLSIAFRAERGEKFPLAVARGALSRARPLGLDLVGGDLSDAKETVVSVFLGGRVEGEPLTRSGAKPGDLLFLSGWPGRAAAGLRLAQRRGNAGPPDSAATPSTGLSEKEERELLDAYRDPEPRVGLGRFLSGERIAHAAIDVSDGLGVDASRLARASNARVLLERDRIPVSPAVARLASALGHDALDWILAGGDDYELLFAVPPELASRLDPPVPDLGTIVTRVGRIEEGSGAVLQGPDGERDVSGLGHDHLDGA
jgi:thiamine-monophosphate kinase